MLDLPKKCNDNGLKLPPHVDISIKDILSGEQPDPLNVAGFDAGIPTG